METTTIEIALVGDAILGRQPLPDALTWHCASSLQTNDTGREERKFHCGLHKAIQGTRRLAARLDERRHQYALLDLSQTIPHGGFAYLSRTARPTKDEDRGSAPANSAPHDTFDANAQSSFYTLKVGPIAPHPRLGQPKAENAYRYSRPIRGASSPSMPRSAPHQQRDLFLRTCGHSPARMQLTTRNLARLRELYKNLAISQRELDQAASDQQTAKAICGRRCQQEARLPQPPS